jgi:hypothetical protein
MMGINFSNDFNYVFDVENIDAKFKSYSGGQLHINNKELILHFKDMPSLRPIIWPLNAIRKFGYHKEIFVIECKLLISKVIS